MFGLTRRWLYASLLLGVMLSLAWLLSGCGGGRRPAMVAPAGHAGTAADLTGALAQLDALPTPAGVDEELFARLKSALGEALREEKSPRMVASPPSGPSNEVDDLSLVEGVGNWVLSWSYRNVGDYNQDGIVNVSDLTPLAVHFLEAKSEETGWPSAADEVIDGDGNGVINIADITPLAANFFHDCAGYSLQSSTMPAGGFSEFDQVDLRTATGEGRLRFEVLLPVILDNPYLRVVAIDAQGMPGADSNVRGVPGMALTVVSLSPRGGLAGTQVQLTAVVEGVEPIAYQWDFGGGAEPNTSTEESPIITLGAEGTYDASLTLSNDYCDYTYGFTLTAGTVANAPQINSVSPSGGIAGQSVRFSVDVTGTPPLEYSWDFGDAGDPQTADVASPLIELGSPGSYDCSVSVINDFGSDSYDFTVEVGTIGSAPRITNISPLKGATGHDQQFVATVEGNPPFTYVWDFGAAADPPTYTEASPTVHLVDTGECQCSLTVDNVYGSDTREFTLDVGPAPVIESVNYGELVTEQDVTFSVTLSGGEGPFAYSWNFGGGAFPNMTSEESPTVTMGLPGQYDGSVTVVNYYGQESFPFSYEVLGIPPAVISIDPTYGGSGEEVVFGASYAGTEPLTFAWDFGGGADPDSSSEEMPTVTLGLGGIYSASLTLTNDWGSDTLDFDLRVGVRSIVDTGNVGNGGLSLAMVNGRPAAAYYDSTDGDLLYCRANDEWGNTWSTPVTIDATGDVGQYVSLCVVSGNPAVSYIEPALGVLKYARAADADGSSWGTPVTPDNTGGVAGYTTLLVVDGQPAISYQGGSLDLMYVRATDTTGGSWGSGVVVYGTDDVGEYASMAVVNGAPAIAFYDATNKDLLYVRALDSTGSTWGSPLSLSTIGDTGKYCSLAVVSGIPCVAFQNSSMGSLELVVAQNADGSVWNTSSTVVGSGMVGGYIKLLEVGGCPGIAFEDMTASDLAYIHAKDAQGSDWDSVVLVDTPGNTGQFTSGVVMLDGRPALTTVEMFAGEVRYLLANDAAGSDWPQP